MLGSSQNKIYLNVADGKIVRRVNEGTKDAVSRVQKNGKIVWELKYSFVTGILTGISIKEGEISGTPTKDWIFDLSDGENNYQLQIQYDSRYATSLLFSLCNPLCDFSEPITIAPWMKVVNDKKKTACYVRQNVNETIPWYFTKEDPNGLPDLKQVTFKGKDTWDSWDRMQFLEIFVNSKVKPLLNKMRAGSGAAPAPQPGKGFGNMPTYTAPKQLTPAPGEDDDLPF
jgi:hypothetical protein